MLRLISGAMKMMARVKEPCVHALNVPPCSFRGVHLSSIYCLQASSFMSGLPLSRPCISPSIVSSPSIFQSQFQTPPSILQSQSRSVTKFSLQKGKRKAVKAVISCFYRLHWGGWIRTRAGRHRFMWKKSGNLKRRLRQHVFCNATQSYLLDKMVTHFWRKPRYYVDDPYEPYHTREEYYVTRKKPLP